MLVRSTRPALIAIALAAATLVPAAATPSAAQQVPPAVAALLPAQATLDTGDWGVFDSGSGKTFSAGLTAKLPGRRMSCDSTVGPEARLELKGDTAWEEPPMLDMAVDMFNQEIGGARQSLTDRVNRLKASNSDIKAVNAVKEERLPNGHLVYLDYAESCAAQGGTNSMLLGFARRGATMLTFTLWLSTDAAGAAAIGKDILARFAALDIKALLK